MNASNLLSSRVTMGVSQFILDRSCAMSTVSTAVFSEVSITGLYAFFDTYFELLNGSACPAHLVTFEAALFGDKHVFEIDYAVWNSLKL